MRLQLTSNVELIKAMINRCERNAIISVHTLYMVNVLNLEVCKMYVIVTS